MYESSMDDGGCVARIMCQRVCLPFPPPPPSRMGSGIGGPVEPPLLGSHCEECLYSKKEKKARDPATVERFPCEEWLDPIGFDVVSSMVELDTEGPLA